MSDLIVKRTYGKPNLEYKTSYLKGFEIIKDKFLLLTLSKSGSKNFELKMPVNHLDIKDDRVISELIIYDDDNRHLMDILHAIYEYNGEILDDVISDNGIMYDVDIKALCDYMDSIEMMEMLLYFDQDGELLFIDPFRMKFKDYVSKRDKVFKDMPTYSLYSSIGVSDPSKYLSDWL